MKMANKLLRFRGPLSSNPLIRLYHSTSHPDPSGPFTPLERNILRAASNHIPTHGFTNTSLVRGATDAGYLAASANLFPQGPWALVWWHLIEKRERLKECKEIIEGGVGKGTGRKVKALTWERLMGNKEVVERWQEALALSLHPSNLRTATHELSLLADEIWYLAGDAAVDMSWYTKRASLAAIYGATELFMTMDKSVGFRDTKEFMERRFEDNSALGEVVGGVGQWVSWTSGATVNVLRSKGVRI